MRLLQRFISISWWIIDLKRKSNTMNTLFSQFLKKKKKSLVLDTIVSSAYYTSSFSTQMPADAHPFISACVPEAAQGEWEMDDLTLQTHCLPNKSRKFFFF